MVHQLTDISDWLNPAASPTGEGSAVLFAQFGASPRVALQVTWIRKNCQNMEGKKREQRSLANVSLESSTCRSSGVAMGSSGVRGLWRLPHPLTNTYDIFFRELFA